MICDYVVKSVVGEENFIDMQPNKSNNYCCGGGGGFLQSGFKDQRLEYGKLKDEQIKATGADYCIAGCHNCHAQIHELSEHYGGGLSGGPPLDVLSAFLWEYSGRTNGNTWEMT